MSVGDGWQWGPVAAAVVVQGTGAAVWGLLSRAMAQRWKSGVWRQRTLRGSHSFHMTLMYSPGSMAVLHDLPLNTSPPFLSLSCLLGLLNLPNISSRRASRA